MTSEPWLPVPFDNAPYRCALDDERLSITPPLGLTADDRSSSSALTESGGPAAGSPPPTGGALVDLVICPNCLTEVDEDFYCSGCGRLVIDRATRPSSEERPRGPEGEPC